MWRTASYVDINAWSAGIVKKAENYELGAPGDCPHYVQGDCPRYAQG